MHWCCIYFIYQLFALLQANAGIPAPPSPCPELFHYDLVDQPKNSIYSKVIGVITVERRQYVKVELKLQLPILTSYNGVLRLKNNNSQPGKNNEVSFIMKYQKDLPIPSVVEIKVNGKLRCWSTPITGPRGRTDLFYSAWFRYQQFTYNHIPTISGTPIADYESWREPPRIPYKKTDQSPGAGPYVPKPPPEPINAWDMAGFETCGLESTAKLLIVKGQEVTKGKGPWMVPLVAEDGSFICTSTLISKQYVITAGHCLTGKNTLIALVGQYDLTDELEENAQHRSIIETHVHPMYHPGKPDYDLALLKLEKEVKLTPYVNIACIWSKEEDLRFIVGRIATVFGWGKDGMHRGFTPTPRVVQSPIVSQETCRESNDKFKLLTSYRTLCAGFRNGSSPCTGDSGGGLMLPENDDNAETRWVLRGVTSISLNLHNSCDPYNYIIYQDVAKYKNWILTIVR